MLVQPASVLNRIADDAAYQATYPKMIGRGGPATHELHTFLADINPSESSLKKYYQAVDDWNAQHPGLQDKMKACFLALIFRGENGEEKTVKVMQSARYYRCDDTDEVVRQMHADADYFASQGLSVIREKIEATAYGIDGIPQTDEEARAYPKYFEFHIKIGQGDRQLDNTPLSEQQVEELKKISRQFSQQFGTPIPLSFNCNPDGVTGDGQGYQRFLNVRFRQQGINSIAPRLAKVTEAITKAGLRVMKTISEYVWYDSFTALDKGWIDFDEVEVSAAAVGAQP